jgi:hypothetical protein
MEKKKKDKKVKKSKKKMTHRLKPHQLVEIATYIKIDYVSRGFWGFGANLWIESALELICGLRAH